MQNVQFKSNIRDSETIPVRICLFKNSILCLFLIDYGSLKQAFPLPQTLSWPIFTLPSETVL